MPKTIEENLPLGAPTRYDTAPNMYCVYINMARQVARMGPGLTIVEIPLVPNITKGEVNRFVVEIHKLMPLAEIRVVSGANGVGIFAMAVDPSYRPPVPTRVDPATIQGSPDHKRLWETCRDQADYLSGRDTDNHNKPDCQNACRYFFPLAGDVGADWGVCTEPRSPRAGLLTYEHMGCPYFEQEPDGSERGDL